MGSFVLNVAEAVYVFLMFVSSAFMGSGQCRKKIPYDFVDNISGGR